MSYIQIARLIVLLLVLFGCFRLGSNLKQAEWDRAENARIEAETIALEEHRAKVDELNGHIADQQLALATIEQTARELNDALQVEISREPVVTTITVERDNCPAVELTLPDAGQHYRLFNCGISGNCQTAPATVPHRGDGELPGPGPIAGLDGNRRFVNTRRDF